MSDDPIPDRWVNAVAEFRVPMDIPIDATPEQKVAAVVATFGEDFPAQLDGADLRWEDVEDGEPIRDESSETDPIPDEVIEQAAWAIKNAARKRGKLMDVGPLLRHPARAAADVLVAFGREQERERIKRDLYELPVHDRPQSDNAVDIDELLEGSVDPGRSIVQRIADAEVRGREQERERIRDDVAALIDPGKYDLFTRGVFAALVAIPPEQERQKARCRYCGSEGTCPDAQGRRCCPDCNGTGHSGQVPATGFPEPVGNPEQLPDRSGPLPDFIGDTDVDIHTCYQDCPCQKAALEGDQ